VVSKQVEPAPDQPPPGANLADASGETAVSDETAPPANQGSAEDTGDQSADSGTNAESDVADDDVYPGERFPATRLDELTVPDVNESGLSDITYAINEMFARHGADFKDKKVAQEFSQFDWYQPRPGASLNQIKNEFSDLEKANLQVLERCRDAKIAASRRNSRSVREQRVQEESTAEKIMRGIKTWQDMGGPLPPHP
jgi:YARHG domain